MKNNKKKNLKTIVVIGGSGVLGKMTLMTLLKNNFRVVNIDLFEIKIKHINYNFILADITKETEVKKVFHILKSSYKKIYGLINHSHYKGNRTLNRNSNFFSKFEDYSYEEWKKTLEVNLSGMFLTTKYFLPLLIKNKYSIIINTSSTYGKVSPNKNIYTSKDINSPISYATTKFAIIGFTKYLATHYGDKGLRANILIPGGIINKNHNKTFVKNYIKLTPVKKMSEPKDYSKAILYLTSENLYMNGAEFVVDGGWTAW